MSWFRAMWETCISLCVEYHFSHVIMGAMASQITRLTIVYSTVYSGADQRKHQSFASLAFLMGTHRLPVNSPHKGQRRGKWFHLMTSSGSYFNCYTDLWVGGNNFCLYMHSCCYCFACFFCRYIHLSEAVIQEICLSSMILFHLYFHQILQFHHGFHQNAFSF